MLFLITGEVSKLSISVVVEHAGHTVKLGEEVERKSDEFTESDEIAEVAHHCLVEFAQVASHHADEVRDGEEPQVPDDRLPEHEAVHFFVFLSHGTIDRIIPVLCRLVLEVRMLNEEVGEEHGEVQHEYAFGVEETRCRVLLPGLDVDGAIGWLRWLFVG
jgi:hypothetical protein